MNNFIVTFKRDGVDSITTVLCSRESDVVNMMHRNSKLRQLARYLKDKNINLKTVSDISLGHILSEIPDFKSNITDIKIRRGKRWEGILYKSINSSSKHTH